MAGEYFLCTRGRNGVTGRGVGRAGKTCPRKKEELVVEGRELVMRFGGGMYEESVSVAGGSGKGRRGGEERWGGGGGCGRAGES